MSGRMLVFILLAAALLVGLFLFLQQANVIDIYWGAGQAIINLESRISSLEPRDIEAQKPLENPPEIIKAVYATSWAAGSEKKLNYLIKLIKETELNAIVIDVKDFSGYLSYNTNLELPKKYNAVELRIPRLNVLIKRLHDEGIYLIGRISVFQDQRLPLARPDLALVSSSSLAIWRQSEGANSASQSEGSRISTLWKDYKGLMWLDSAAQEVWDYNIAIAKEILDRGFDEANFDYIRFASDGDLNDIKHPFWDEKTLKTRIIRDFFKYLREQLPASVETSAGKAGSGYRISADLFGLVTVNTDGLGIGQHLEFALPYFDAVAPMVYPSHYFKGFINYENPSAHPYEVIRYSLDTAVRRMKEFYKIASTTPVAKLRPWLQDFDLGADYDAAMVRSEMQAVYDAAASSAPDYFGGWMLWNPSNIYTREALLTND